MADRKDPHRGYNFKLEIGGEEKAAFRELSGFHAPSSITEPNQEGDEEFHALRKLPGLNKYSNISLKQ
jgi:hypothetical protein